MKAEEFINWIIPRTKNNVVLQSLAIAQACLESAYGKKHFYNNYYGIKCHKGVDCRHAKTKEFYNGNYRNISAYFAIYNSFDECFADYLYVLSHERYRKVREAKNYIQACYAIKECGYATSPAYPESLMRIIEKHKLYILDWRHEQEMRLTENFTYEEFWSRSERGIKIEPPEELFPSIQRLANELQKVRNIIKLPIIVTSGYRTTEWNKKIGGATNSYHIQGLAVDSYAKGMYLVDYALYLARYTDFNGFGINLKKNFVHTDFREKFTVFHY